MSLVHKDDYYETPEWMVYDLKTKTNLDFTLDVCANMANSKCTFYFSEEENALTKEWWRGKGYWKPTVFCNPPRSKNGKFVKKALEQWEKHDLDIVILLTWNDFGNKYGQPLIDHLESKSIEIFNYGKVIFDKHGEASKWPSRLNYCAVWLKKRDK